MNTETLGCTSERLSILALRVYDLAEPLDRNDIPEDHFDSVRITKLQRPCQPLARSNSNSPCPKLRFKIHLRNCYRVWVA
jgi:hypothetical protein